MGYNRSGTRRTARMKLRQEAGGPAGEEGGRGRDGPAGGAEVRAIR